MVRKFENSARAPQQNVLPYDDGRTPRQIERHYLIEKELATHLREASREERGKLYTRLYDELFERVPDHPMLTRKANSNSWTNRVESSLRLIRPFLTPDATFLELGPGDCLLSLAVCRHVRFVYAVDVSKVITEQTDTPDNFSLLISDGREVPVRPGSIAVAFSNQLIEHLHPDDAHEQTVNLWSALKEGGHYICVTPNRLAGPHDISQYFDETATGFHLKEYTTGELADLLSECGFSRVKAVVRLKNVKVTIPTGVVSSIERAILLLPRKLRRQCAGSRLVSAIIGVCLVARK